MGSVRRTDLYRPLQVLHVAPAIESRGVARLAPRRETSRDLASRGATSTSTAGPLDGP